MPIQPLKLNATVDVEKTQTLNESGISFCNLIRFFDGLIQKLGGWTKFYPLAVSGVPKALHGWEDLNAQTHLAVGTTTQLAVITSGTLQPITPQQLVSDFPPDFSTISGSPLVEVDDPNIANVTTDDSVFFNTPISVGGITLKGLYAIEVITGTTSYQVRATADATATVSNGGDVPQFTTTAGSSTVLVTFNDHGLSPGQSFTFPIATTNDGVTILGTYQALTVPSGNTFTIAVSTQAIAGVSFVMNNGDAEILYNIALGPLPAGAGYGLGGYGEGGYGTGVVPASQTGIPITATDWALDNWGQVLLSNPRGGGIYQWSPTGGFANAQLVSTAPAFNNGIFVAMPQQILVAWGSVSSGQQQDPLTVRWSTILDYTNWEVSTQTQAGSFRIPTGSEIRGGLQGPQQALIWTDLDLYAMQYLGYPLVWGFNQISTGCGLVGPHAACTMRNSVYWMSQGNFFVLSGGGVREIPCTVWDKVFQNFDTANQNKCVAAPNSMFDEITFYYPSLTGGTGEIDSYVKYNVVTGAWDYGSLSRTAWIDQSVLGQPIGTTPGGLIYQHETSNDADGQPLNSWFQSGWFTIAEGQQFAFVDWFWPDFKWALASGGASAQVIVTIFAVDYPNGSQRTYGPFTMTSATQYINTRLRGRQISIKVESNDIGSFWRLGDLKFRIQQQGRR